MDRRELRERYRSLMTEFIPHVLEMRREIDPQGSRVLVVVTDLPVCPTTPGFDAQSRHDFGRAIGHLAGDGKFEYVMVLYKGRNSGT
jgi:hypothetical protein